MLNCPRDVVEHAVPVEWFGGNGTCTHLYKRSMKLTPMFQSDPSSLHCEMEANGIRIGRSQWR
jgi:hypothetical protein